MGRRVTCIDCTLQSSVEYEYFKERFSVSCAASFSKVSILAAVEWLLALPQGCPTCLLSSLVVAVATRHKSNSVLWQSFLQDCIGRAALDACCRILLLCPL